MALPRFLARDDFSRLFDLLQRRFDRVVGPTLKSGAIAYAELKSSGDLPVGYQEQTAPGHYHLRQVGSQRFFDHVTTAQGLKPWLFPPREPLWRVRVGHHSFEPCDDVVPSTVIIGARACDLAGVELLDRHFAQGAYPDPRYQSRRSNLFLIAVNCQRCVSTCFCLSTGDGPEVTQGYDWAVDELDNGFVIVAGSQAGHELLDELNLPRASALQLADAVAKRLPATRQQTRLPDSLRLAELRPQGVTLKPWQSVAERCLSCGNCTAVCPSCFCFQCHDESPVGSKYSEHIRQWDSCFSDEQSYIVGTVVRKEVAQKYRQWLMHKLVYWQAQYGRIGCTGCGRCMIWCPAAIDLVDEATRLCRNDERV